MKLFAITPGDCTADRLFGLLPRLRDRGATHVYLRAAALRRNLFSIAAAAASSGILPIVPHELYARHLRPCGAHFTSCEIDRISREAPDDADIITASGHSSEDARLAIQAGADFVFVSPVYAPLSKADNRERLHRADVQALVSRYGEKVVLLGGLTPERIRELERSMPALFSAAGISMFFSHSGQ